MRKSVAVKSSPLTWSCRALWLSLPLLLGDLFSARLTGTTAVATTVWQLFLWAAWVLGMGASVVQLPRALTVMRMVMPLAALTGVAFWLTAGWADVGMDRGPGVLGIIGLVVSFAVAGLVMSADVGADFIDGASYGDEQRLGLSPPAFLLVGPIQILWFFGTVPIVLCAALFAAELWLQGVFALVPSLVACWYGFRLLNRLSERCVVMVPAGMTLVDSLALAEPTLFRRDDTVRLGPAVVGADGRDGVLDLTVGAPGLVLAMDFSRQLTVVPSPRRGGVAEPVEVSSVLIAPSRPGRLLEIAESRRISVSRA